MSLYYKCDCCGQIIQKLGDNNKKRLHLDIGDQTDYDFEADNGHNAWDITEYPLIQLDLCSHCYSETIAKICFMRSEHNLSKNLEEVSIGGKSVSM